MSAENKSLSLRCSQIKRHLVSRDERERLSGSDGIRMLWRGCLVMGKAVIPRYCGGLHILTAVNNNIDLPLFWRRFMLVSDAREWKHHNQIEC